MSLTNTSADGFNGRVTVTAVVEPLEDATRRLEPAQIQFLNVPQGWQVAVDPDDPVYVRLRGLEQNLAAVDASQLSGTIDVEAWMQENGLSVLSEGNVEMEVSVAFPDTVSQVGTVRASVSVMADVSAVHGAAGEAAAGTA